MLKPKAKPAPKRLAATRTPAKPKRKPRKETDWVKIELAYTTSSRTMEDIGRQYGVTKGRICQKATEMGWKRGALADRVRAQAAAKVAAQEAHDAKVQEGTEEAVEVSAVLMANTILRERRDVGRLLRIATTLADKLDEQTKPPTGRPKRDAPKAEPLAAQIDSLRKLGATLGQLVDLERTVLGIATSAGAGAPPPPGTTTTVVLDFESVRKKAGAAV